MRPHPLSHAIFALAALGLPGQGAALAEQSPAPGTSAPAPAASAASSALAALTVNDEERPLDAEPFPGEPSKQPTAAEWAAAPRVRLTRMGPAAAGCRAYRTREWLRFRCPDLVVAAISLLGGRAEGVAFWTTPPKGSDLPRGGEVMLPLRPGDRRVIQLLTFGPGYDGPFTILPAVVLQEQWLEGDPAPTLIAR